MFGLALLVLLLFALSAWCQTVGERHLTVSERDAGSEGQSSLAEAIQAQASAVMRHRHRALAKRWPRKRLQQNAACTAALFATRRARSYGEPGFWASHGRVRVCRQSQRHPSVELLLRDSPACSATIDIFHQCRSRTALGAVCLAIEHRGALALPNRALCRCPLGLLVPAYGLYEQLTADIGSALLALRSLLVIPLCLQTRVERLVALMGDIALLPLSRVAVGGGGRFVACLRCGEPMRLIAGRVPALSEHRGWVLLRRVLQGAHPQRLVCQGFGGWRLGRAWLRSAFCRNRPVGTATRFP